MAQESQPAGRFVRPTVLLNEPQPAGRLRAARLAGKGVNLHALKTSPKYCHHDSGVKAKVRYANWSTGRSMSLLEKLIAAVP